MTEAKETPEITVVVPAKDEAASLPELHERLAEVLGGLAMPYEIILIDDGSSDDSLSVMKEINSRDGHVRVVSFMRNFGKAAALSAGFERARGEIIITMDADLQDDPDEIPRFIEAIESGYHLVTGWKKERHDPSTRLIASRVANTATAWLSGVRVHDMNCGFKAYRREVAKSISLYGELHRFVPALAAARGFKVGEIAVRHHPRKHGRSRYGLERLPRGFFDLLTVLFLTSYSARPLHLFGGAGMVFGGLGFMALAYLTALWFLGLGPIGTRPLFMGGIMLMILGAQLLSLGLLGELVTSMSARPEDRYVVGEEL